jgi:hypothetical protein
MTTIANVQRISPQVISLGHLLNTDLAKTFKLKRDGSLRKRDVVKCLQVLAWRQGIDLGDLRPGVAQ